MNNSSSSECNGFTLLENTSFLSNSGGQPIMVGRNLEDKIYLSLSSAILFATIVVGILGNVFVIGLIALKKPLRRSPNFQLASLAVADLMVCGITAPVHLHGSLRVLNGSYYVCSEVSKAACSVYLLTFHTSFFTSLMSLVCISLTRAIIVGRPLARREQKILIGICVALSYVSGIARGLHVFFTREMDRTCLLHVVSVEGRSQTKVQAFLPTSVLISFLVVSICYGFIYLEVRRVAAAVHVDGAATNVNKDKNNIATTKICLTIVLIFLLFNMPHVFIFFMKLGGWRKTGNISPFVGHLFLSVWLASSAVNPISYALRSSAFRRQVRSLFQRNLPSG
ncbi:rhodopsin, GQ-coupled-like [Ptychodera flava]|uniref:rhodopsin, GQ-coupled-like n=1 Tax=Ptychodera flava TaxID=63121 RepID=UPI003969DCD4